MKTQINEVQNESGVDISFEDVRLRAIAFTKDRGWFPQEPEDLAKSIMIEAAELLEHFQWDMANKSYSKKGLKEKNWDEIRLELADIIIYIIGFANNSGIDLVEAVKDKLDKLDIKYPVSEFMNGHNDTFYKSQKEKYRKERSS
jgi:dCTP diphosphatase